VAQQQVHRLSNEERLLLSVIEQFSRPLLQIERLAELAGQTPPEPADWQAVQLAAASSLQLAESYSLSLRLHGQLTPLELEPLAVSSLLYDIAQALAPQAKQYGVALELDTGPRMAPVMGDKTVLRAALLSLGQVFVQSSAEQEQPVAVRLAAHRGRYGAVAGLYSSGLELGADSLRQARHLYGRARQPLQRLVSGPGAGVFVADSLLASLQSHLHVARYHKLTGLAATLTPSSQLQLV
jgi:hypothetical protein